MSSYGEAGAPRAFVKSSHTKMRNFSYLVYTKAKIDIFDCCDFYQLERVTISMRTQAHG